MTNDNTFVRSLDAAGPVPMAEAADDTPDHAAGALEHQSVFQ